MPGKMVTEKRPKSELARDAARKKFSEDRNKTAAKYYDRGDFGEEQKVKENMVTDAEFTKDLRLVKKYGKDSMKSKSFATKRYMNGGCVMAGRGVRKTKMG